MRRVRVPLVPRWLRWSAVLAVAAGIGYFSVFASVPPGAGESFGTAGTRATGSRESRIFLLDDDP
jgi:hypothetical protein